MWATETSGSTCPKPDSWAPCPTHPNTCSSSSALLLGHKSRFVWLLVDHSVAGTKQRALFWNPRGWPWETAVPAELPEGGVHNQAGREACSCVSEAVSGQACGEVRLGKDNLGEDILSRKIQAEIPEKPPEAGGLVKQFLILRIWNMETPLLWAVL